MRPTWQTARFPLAEPSWLLTLRCIAGSDFAASAAVYVKRVSLETAATMQSAIEAARTSALLGDHEDVMMVATLASAGIISNGGHAEVLRKDEFRASLSMLDRSPLAVRTPPSEWTSPIPAALFAPSVRLSENMKKEEKSSRCPYCRNHPGCDIRDGVCTDCPDCSGSGFVERGSRAWREGVESGLIQDPRHEGARA